MIDLQAYMQAVSEADAGGGMMTDPKQMAEEYEAFIGWIEIQVGLALDGTTPPRLILKQIRGRIRHPEHTQLEKARTLRKDVE